MLVIEMSFQEEKMPSYTLVRFCGGDTDNRPLPLVERLLSSSSSIIGAAFDYLTVSVPLPPIKVSSVLSKPAVGVVG